MAHSQPANRLRVTPKSGTSKQPNLPKLLSYPGLLSGDLAIKQIRNIYCYVIQHYGKDGLSVLIYRQPQTDQVMVMCGDWRGNPVEISDRSDLANTATKFLTNDLTKILTLLRTIRVQQVQLFFGIDEEGTYLVDMQVALNKMAGPGMIRDIFSNVVRTQQVNKIEIIDDRAIEYLERGNGSYVGDLILKPTRFRMAEVSNGKYQPLYVEIRR